MPEAKPTDTTVEEIRAMIPADRPDALISAKHVAKLLEHVDQAQKDRDAAVAVAERASRERDDERATNEGLCTRIDQLESKMGAFLAFEAAQEARRKRAAAIDSHAPPRRARGRR